ncbi:sterol desaturase family protein [Segetibacter sp. 3557_3]|nr:sterol desaturase family protein [Segetibacter sp. 3557_3]
MKRAKIQGRIAGNPDFAREISYSLVSCLIFAIIGAVILYTPIVDHTLIYQRIDDYPLWYFPVSVALSLVIHDTYFYWIHRLLHHKRLFRLAHLVHHKSVNPSPWTSYSFHFAESVLEGGIMVVLAFVLPMHPLAIFLFVLIGFIINVYGHLGYEIMPKGLRHSWLFQVLNTSVHHNLHHSKFKGNYGLYFRIWDRVCGTEHPDYVKEYDKIQQQRFGELQTSVRKIDENRMTA